MSKPSLFIAIPTRGQLDYEFLGCLQSFKKLASEVFDVQEGYTYGCSLIDHARSHLATIAYIAKQDVCLWLDDDMLFEPDEVLRMCEEARRTRCVIGAPSMTKRVGGELNVQWPPGQTQAKFFELGSVQQVRSIGTAVMAVPWCIYDAIAGMLPDCKGPDGKPIYPFFLPMIVDGFYCGEDKSFCVRVNAAGFRVMCDTRMRVYHKGTYPYALEDSGREHVHYRKLTINLVHPKT